MIRHTNSSRRRDFFIGCGKYVLLALVMSVACSEQKFRWKTRKLNVRTHIEGDSLLRIEGVSLSATFGFSADDPIKLGTTKLFLSQDYPAKYLSTLCGPRGEQIYFRRLNSCCPFKTKNSSKEKYQNLAVLEKYAVWYPGLGKELILYINIFDEGPVLAPAGLSYTPYKQETK